MQRIDNQLTTSRIFTTFEFNKFLDKQLSKNTDQDIGLAKFLNQLTKNRNFNASKKHIVLDRSSFNSIMSQISLHLPLEIWAEIFSHLSFYERIKLSPACKEIRNLIYNMPIEEMFIQNQFLTLLVYQPNDRSLMSYQRLLHSLERPTDFKRIEPVRYPGSVYTDEADYDYQEVSITSPFPITGAPAFLFTCSVTLGIFAFIAMMLIPFVISAGLVVTLITLGVLATLLTLSAGFWFGVKILHDSDKNENCRFKTVKFLYGLTPPSQIGLFSSSEENRSPDETLFVSSGAVRVAKPLPG